MNKNRKIKRKIAASVAVGMSVMMGVTPAFAASGTSDSDVYKEETVYVNAKASGKTDKVTVSNWLKNSGSVSGNLEDESTLSDIKNVKGDEKYTADGDKLTWSTDSEDIYYQGTTDKKLPVSVKLKYYLDGKEMKPSELKGKSGHLKITVDYKNNEKKNVSVDGKDTEVYTPFVMMTGMILPNETFSNVTIDNGKIISDGNKNIVIGFGMPGLKDSLNLSSEESDKVTIPESLSIEADVKDFTMSSTYTVALSDLLDDMNMDDIADVDDLQTALDDLEDAALQLVSGSDTLADGAGTLAEGVDTLNAGIQKYLGSNGELSGSVTEYVNGVNKVVKGVQDYTNGVNTLADGVSSYVDGEKQLAAGASQLTQLSTGLKKVQSAIAKMEASTDGKGKDREDIKVASSELAAGTQALEDSLGTKQVQALMAQVGSMVQTGNELIAQTEQLESGMQKGVKEPVTNIVKELTVLQKELDGLNTQLTNLKTTCESKVTELNTAIDDYNNKVAAAKNAANTSSEKISQSIQALETQKSKASSDAEKQQLQQSIDALKNAKTAADGLKNVNTVEKASISIDNIDTSDITKGIKTLTGNLQTASKTMEGLGSQLGEMQTKLDTITAAKDKIPADQLNSLTSNITKLNAGMQGLDAGISELAAGISTLDSETSAQFPTAIQGITALNKGFAQLSGYNGSLVSGANKLKSNSPTLVAGVNTLQSGTNQLASGLNTLGSQMSSGSATLAANSGALRNGASELQSGAKELAEGMAKFDKEGTSKLKSTVEDELGDVIDRIDVLTSEDCKYNTFSGKDKEMDGNVKFVIETDSIE